MTPYFGLLSLFSTEFWLEAIEEGSLEAASSSPANTKGVPALLHQANTNKLHVTLVLISGAIPCNCIQRQRITSRLLKLSARTPGARK